MQVLEQWDHGQDKGCILAFAEQPLQAVIEVYYCREPKNFNGLSLQFKTSSIQQFIDTLPEQVEFTGPQARPWGASYLYLRDPNGIQVIVYAGCH